MTAFAGSVLPANFLWIQEETSRERLLEIVPCGYPALRMTRLEAHGAPGDQPWRGERVVSEDLARQLIRDHMPGLPPGPISFLAAGWDNTVFRCARDWVVRFPRREMAVRLLRGSAACCPLWSDACPLPIPYPEYLAAPSEAFLGPLLRTVG